MKNHFDINASVINLKKISGNSLKLLLLLFKHAVLINSEDDLGLFSIEKSLSTKDIFDEVGLTSFETTESLKELVSMKYISFVSFNFFYYENGFEYLKDYSITTSGLGISY